MKVTAVIPVLNEIDSAALLIEEFRHLIASLESVTLSVVFVDGGSSDGTLELLHEQSRIFEWSFVLSQREKSGLGAAYAEGIQYSIANLSPDFILEFDGDRQHRVQDIPLLLNRAQEGFDYIIGSRFVEGGGIPKDWGWQRVFLSSVGNWIARTALQIPVRDVTSGFKLSRVNGFLDRFNFSTILSKRHAYKVHLLYFMIEKGASWCEVPIIFEPRLGGESKLIKNDILDMLKVLYCLRQSS